MKIIEFSPKILHQIPYRYSGKAKTLAFGEYPIHHAFVDKLPKNTNAMFVTSDLQGVEISQSGSGRLLGHVLVETLLELSTQTIIPPASVIGDELASELFSSYAADSRGASGDVTSTRRTFGLHFQWVARVAGNHDRFGAEPKPKFDGDTHLHFLDGNIIDMHSYKFAGISGIIGNTRKILRRSETEFIQTLRILTMQNPELLIPHEGPDHPIKPYKGRTSICTALENTTDLMVVFGHCFWPEPLYQMNNNVQLLNVDSRGLLLSTSRNDNHK